MSITSNIYYDKLVNVIIYVGLKVNSILLERKNTSTWGRKIRSNYNNTAIKKLEELFKVLEEVLGDLTFNRSLRNTVEVEALRIAGKREGYQ